MTYYNIYDFGKSEVDRFQYLLDKHKFDSQQVYFITGTTGDIEEARKVSIGTIIAVLNGFHDETLPKVHNLIFASHHSMKFLVC